jgi:hypothetical protein
MKTITTVVVLSICGIGLFVGTIACLHSLAIKPIVIPLSQAELKHERYLASQAAIAKDNAPGGFNSKIDRSPKRHGCTLTQDEISACYIAVGRGNDLPRSWRQHYYEGYYK